MRYIVLSLLIEKDGEAYCASCRELDVASGGQTVEEAAGNVVDAVDLYLNTIEEMGLREQIFREQGIEIKSAIPFSFTCETRIGPTRELYIRPFLHKFSPEKAYA